MRLREKTQTSFSVSGAFPVKGLETCRLVRNPGASTMKCDAQRNRVFPPRTCVPLYGLMHEPACRSITKRRQACQSRFTVPVTHHTIPSVS